MVHCATVRANKKFTREHHNTVTPQQELQSYYGTTFYQCVLYLHDFLNWF